MIQTINNLISNYLPNKQPLTIERQTKRLAQREGRAIDGVLAAAKLSSRIHGKIKISRIAGYMRFPVQRNDPVGKIASARDDIEAVLSALRGVETRVRFNKTMVYFEVQYPLERRNLEWADIDLDRLRPQAMAIGQDFSGAMPVPVTINFKDRAISNLLIAGATGSGKTAVTMSALLALAHATSPKDAQIIIIDPKGSGHLSPLSRLPHASLYTATQDSADAIASVKAELDRRKTAPDKRQVYLVIDELAELFNETGKGLGIVEQLTSIAGLGREKWIRVIGCTQKPNVKAVDTNLRAHFPMRLAGKVGTREESTVAAGIENVGCEYLEGKGQFYFVENAAARRIQSYYVPDANVQTVIDQICQRWANAEPYQIAAVAPTVERSLPDLPSLVSVEQLFSVVGTFSYGKLFKDGQLRNGMKIKAIRAAFGDDAQDKGTPSRWAVAVVPYLRDHWQQIQDAMGA